MHLDNYSVNNPIILALRNHQVTPEYLYRVCTSMGITSLHDFLTYFEPKQEYVEQDNGAGNGQTATETQHYIDLNPIKGTNPHQKASNPYGTF